MASESMPTGEGSSSKDAAFIPQLPPDIAMTRSATADELIAEMSKMPLFMQNLDSDDGDNIELEAIKALAYDGEPHEVAQNFRTQGNESYRTYQWIDAVEFYTKALAVKCGVKEIDEACYANRAACNLELQNYGRTNRDCAEALKLNPKNVKAWYRSARACFALDKMDETQDCISRGLAVDENNAALKTLSIKVEKRAAHLKKIEDDRKERERIEKAKSTAMNMALKRRNITLRTTTNKPPSLPAETRITLTDLTDPSSTLTFPTIILYPLHLQSDFIQALPETSTIYSQLEEVFDPESPPAPWDEQGEFVDINKLDIFVERKKYDMHGKPGLSKVGKKVTLGKLLEEGKLEVVDGLVSVLVVPKARVDEFIKGWKEKNPM